MKINIISISFCIVIYIGYSDNLNTLSKKLPLVINSWQCSESIQYIDSSNIFDYMNGGGELYLGYRFDHLEVLEYLSEDKNTILVEIYQMKTSDDAFGLLSLDWSGEPVYLNDQIESEKLLAPSARALYGSGLLRLVTGNHYIRIMAFRETVDAKNTVIEIGKILYKDYSPEPEIVKRIPSLTDIGYNMDSDRIAFFRSHLVLNSLFYLSHQNLLNLDHSVKAVTVTYNSQPKDINSDAIQLMIIKYTNHQKAKEALNHFLNEYISDSKTVIKINELRYTNNFIMEEGWLSCRRENNFIVFVFNIPDKITAKKIINHIKLN